MGSNCCKGDAAKPVRSSSSIYSRSRAGASLDERFTRSDDKGGIRLTVTAAQTGDSDLYTLVASNAAGSDAARFRLEVSADEAPTGEDPPTFLRRLQDLTVKVGTRTRFLVEIVSSAECKVTWYRNERRLMEAERISLARDGNFWCADVAVVNVDDAGRWTCTAENTGGRASCSAHLNVLVPKAYKRPEFVEELRALLTEQGTVSLECKVVGVPTPVLRWFKDSCEIKAGDVFALTANAEDPTSLGTYTCEAVNCMGRAYSSSKVHVVGRNAKDTAGQSISRVTSEPPLIFTKELMDQSVKISEPLNLSCHIVVPPWPRSVVWYNKEGKIEASERYHVLEDGVGGYLLEVPSAEWPDEGEWKCVATSSGGRVGISTCFVSMDVPKNFRKPRFMENLQAVLTEEGLVSFECKVVGFPTPVLSWFKDGQELKPGDVYQLTGTNSLGSYCCIARNCMGQACSSAELTVEDIQNQLNDEEKLQLFSKNQAPKFVQGLKSIEAKIDEPFRFNIKVAIPPEPLVSWYRDDQPVDESTRCFLGNEDRGVFYIDIQHLEFSDQAEWKCVAMNDFGHSVTSCFLKLIIPRHYKKPRFLENLQAVLSEEGAVNLECKVIGVPQPVLKWYKDGEELKPGDIHRIISGQDGTCCLGTYTCEAQNCMGIAASSASLLGFEDSVKTKNKKSEETALQRNLSLSTIHEERTSQMYDTPVGDITLDDKGEISFSFDGKEVSVSLYETPDLTEEEALQIIEMYADQLSENVTEHNVVELPPLRFVKETSTSGNLLMEAIIIDVSPDYFASPEEDLRTEADIEDISIAEENGAPQLSLDQEISENYLEKAMELLSDEKSDIPKKCMKQTDSIKSFEDYFSLSRDQSLSEEKRDEDDTQVLSDLQSFASAHSIDKLKSYISKHSTEEGQEASDMPKTILQKNKIIESEPLSKPKYETKSSQGSRKSSLESEISNFTISEEKSDQSKILDKEEIRLKLVKVGDLLNKIIGDVQLIEKDIIIKSESMSSIATSSKSLEIINNIIAPITEIQNITEIIKESLCESKEFINTVVIKLPQSLQILQQSLTIVGKCIEVGSDNKTLVKKTCEALIEKCCFDVQILMSEINDVIHNVSFVNENIMQEITSTTNHILEVIKLSNDAIKISKNLHASAEIKENKLLEDNHLKDTQKAIFELRNPLNFLLCIIENAESGKLINTIQAPNCDVILNEMSVSIQDLQTALEQIEELSVKESSFGLNKYNTKIIEAVMNPIVNLRSSFEQLSNENNKQENEFIKPLALSSIKQNLCKISEQISTFDNDIGTFDILHTDNKLPILQKMAQALIAFESELTKLEEKMPNLASSMILFHKNIASILENAIESNDVKKYYDLIKICDSVERINIALLNVVGENADNLLFIASIGNNLRIIQNNLIHNVFESELNCSTLSSIADILIRIQEEINQAEQFNLEVSSEHIQEISPQSLKISEAVILIEHLEHSIGAISIIGGMIQTQDFQKELSPVLENIRPILETIKENIALSWIETIKDEQIVNNSYTLSSLIINPSVSELNKHIFVLNQCLLDNIEIIQEEKDIIPLLAETVYNLHKSLEIIQHDTVTQCLSDLETPEVNISIADAVQNLHSCMVLIEENAGIDCIDEISTLEDISGIKTTAELVSTSDRLLLPTTEETIVELLSQPYNYKINKPTDYLRGLIERIMIMQNPEIVIVLDSLSSLNNYSSLKAFNSTLGKLNIHSQKDSILQEIKDLNIFSTSILNADILIALNQSLCLVNFNDMPTHASSLQISSERLHFVFNILSEIKEYLDNIVNVILPAIVLTDRTILISDKVEILRGCSIELSCLIKSISYLSNNDRIRSEIKCLEENVNNFIKITDVAYENMNIDKLRTMTEVLFDKIMVVQEEVINCSAYDLETLAEEASLLQSFNKIESQIAILQEYNFIDLSHISSMNTSISQKIIALQIKPDFFRNIENVIDNACIVVEDNQMELLKADHKQVIENLYKACKSEFTIMCYILKKDLTKTSIIRLLQEFINLRNTISSFKLNNIVLLIPNEESEKLKNFLILADDCIDCIERFLIKVIDLNHAEQLFSTHLYKFKDFSKSSEKIILSRKDPSISQVVHNFVKGVDLMIPMIINIHDNLINEIESKLEASNDQCDNVMEKLNEIRISIDNEISHGRLSTNTKLALNNLLSFMNKCSESTKRPKLLILIQCFSDCIDTLLELTLDRCETSELLIEGIRQSSNHLLNEVLTEMLLSLESLESGIIEINKKNIEEPNEDMDSVGHLHVSIIDSLTKIQNGYLQMKQLKSDDIAFNTDKIIFLRDAENKIYSIEDTIKNLYSLHKSEQLNNLLNQTLENVELQLIRIKDFDSFCTTYKSIIQTEIATEILHHLDQYIEIIETVKEIAAFMKIEELTSSLHTAQELRDSITSIKAAKDSKQIKITEKELSLAKKLQTAVAVFRVEVLESFEELVSIISTEVFQRFIQITANLQTNLIAITEEYDVLEVPSTQKIKIFNELLQSDSERNISLPALEMDSHRLDVEKEELVTEEFMAQLKSDNQSKMPLIVTNEQLAITSNIANILEQEHEIVEEEQMQTKSNVSRNQEVFSVEITQPTLFEEVTVTKENILSEHVQPIMQMTELEMEINKESVSLHQQLTSELISLHIKDYTSNEVAGVITTIYHYTKEEKLIQSLQIAKELGKIITNRDLDLHSIAPSPLVRNLQDCLLTLQLTLIEKVYNIPHITAATTADILNIINYLQSDLVALNNEPQIYPYQSPLYQSLEESTSEESHYEDALEIPDAIFHAEDHNVPKSIKDIHFDRKLKTKNFEGLSQDKEDTMDLIMQHVEQNKEDISKVVNVLGFDMIREALINDIKNYMNENFTQSLPTTVQKLFTDSVETSNRLLNSLYNFDNFENRNDLSESYSNVVKIADELHNEIILFQNILSNENQIYKFNEVIKHLQDDLKSLMQIIDQNAHKPYVSDIKLKNIPQSLSLEQQDCAEPKLYTDLDEAVAIVQVLPDVIPIMEKTSSEMTQNNEVQSCDTSDIYNQLLNKKMDKDPVNIQEIAYNNIINMEITSSSEKNSDRDLLQVNPMDNESTELTELLKNATNLESQTIIEEIYNLQFNTTEHLEASKSLDEIENVGSLHSVDSIYEHQDEQKLGGNEVSQVIMDHKQESIDDINLEYLTENCDMIKENVTQNSLKHIDELRKNEDSQGNEEKIVECLNLEFIEFSPNIAKVQELLIAHNTHPPIVENKFEQPEGNLSMIPSPPSEIEQIKHDNNQNLATTTNFDSDLKKQHTNIHDNVLKTKLETIQYEELPCEHIEQLEILGQNILVEINDGDTSKENYNNLSYLTQTGVIVMLPDTKESELRYKINNDSITLQSTVEPISDAISFLQYELDENDFQNQKLAEIKNAHILETFPDSAHQLQEPTTFITKLEEFVNTSFAGNLENLSDTKMQQIAKCQQIGREVLESVLNGDMVVISHDDSEQQTLLSKFEESLSLIETPALYTTSDIIDTEIFEKFATVVVELKKLLQNVNCCIEMVESYVTESTYLNKEENSLNQLEELVAEVERNVESISLEKTVEEINVLKDILVEMQSIIIELKHDYDGASDDTLNETLDDLECSVRSVQLQIIENSPSTLLNEACATLKLLVNNLKDASNLINTIPKKTYKNEIFEQHSTSTETTISLINKASNVNVTSDELEFIVAVLDEIKQNIKFLKEKFLFDAETIIENGIDILENLKQLEDKVFSSEKEINTNKHLSDSDRDNILTAMHSVYGTISNMSSTLSSVQKSYLYENYGKPSQNILHLIKSISPVAKFDSISNNRKWKNLEMILRKVLNHFEDIKFYINLDKTARTPNEAAFTIIILDELKKAISQILTDPIDTDIGNSICCFTNCVDSILSNISVDTTMQVKHKIPIFKEIAEKASNVTKSMKSFLENKLYEQDKSDIKSIDINERETCYTFLSEKDKILHENTETNELSEILNIEQTNVAHQVENKILEQGLSLFSSCTDKFETAVKSLEDENENIASISTVNIDIMEPNMLQQINKPEQFAIEKIDDDNQPQTDKLQNEEVCLQKIVTDETKTLFKDENKDHEKQVEKINEDKESFKSEGQQGLLTENFEEDLQMEAKEEVKMPTGIELLELTGQQKLVTGELVTKMNEAEKKFLDETHSKLGEHQRFKNENEEVENVIKDKELSKLEVQEILRKENEQVEEINEDKTPLKPVEKQKLLEENHKDDLQMEVKKEEKPQGIEISELTEQQKLVIDEEQEMKDAEKKCLEEAHTKIREPQTSKKENENVEKINYDKELPKLKDQQSLLMESLQEGKLQIGLKEDVKKHDLELSELKELQKFDKEIKDEEKECIEKEQQKHLEENIQKEKEVAEKKYLKKEHLQIEEYETHEKENKEVEIINLDKELLTIEDQPLFPKEILEEKNIQAENKGDEKENQVIELSKLKEQQEIDKEEIKEHQIFEKDNEEVEIINEDKELLKLIDQQKISNEILEEQNFQAEQKKRREERPK